ncbi:MAG TPA: hypothetical protein VLV78_16725 [Thermoanaerobaculia bacterium]|nr:hypothetical protein [Thermoanaerobaculia bacterium]
MPADATARADANRIVESVWFEPKTIRSGQVEALHIRTAPSADVKEVSGILASLNGTARMPFQCSSAGEGSWNCTITVGSCAACGRWKIEHLKVTGRSGAASDVASSQPPVSTAAVFISSDRCDSAAPVLHAVAVEAVGSGGDDVVVTLTVDDPYCGVSSVIATVKSAKGDTARLAATLAGEGDTWAARFNVSPSTARGTWRVLSVEVGDEAGNIRSYIEGNPLLKDATFELR